MFLFLVEFSRPSKMLVWVNCFYKNKTESVSKWRLLKEVTWSRKIKKLDILRNRKIKSTSGPIAWTIYPSVREVPSRFAKRLQKLRKRPIIKVISKFFGTRLRALRGIVKIKEEKSDKIWNQFWFQTSINWSCSLLRDAKGLQNNLKKSASATI